MAEVALFVAMFILFIILYNFYKSSRAQARVWKDSRCYRETQMSKEHNIYAISAKVRDRPAFDVAYNTNKNTTEITCACPIGNVQSVMRNIPYYDLRPNTPYKDRVRYRDRLTCDCETDVSVKDVMNSSKMTYQGDPGVRMFMEDPNSKRDFMDRLVYGQMN